MKKIGVMLIVSVIILVSVVYVTNKFDELLQSEGEVFSESNGKYQLSLATNGSYFKPTMDIDFNVILTRDEKPTSLTSIGAEGEIVHYSISSIDNDIFYETTPTDHFMSESLDVNGRLKYSTFPYKPHLINLNSENNEWPTGKYIISIDVKFDEFIQVDGVQTKLSDNPIEISLSHEYYVIDFKNIFSWIFK